jgi:predicted dehydrogenase
MNTAVIGCGRISGQYLWNSRQYGAFKITACADLDTNLARAKAEEFKLPKHGSVADILADDSIELVLNLTTPAAHHPVTLQCLRAGKHVYCEKPLAITREQGREILTEAAKRKLTVGCAPDTFLGSGVQTARALIDGGAIGRPLAFTAFMMCRGHESWHPSPEFYYEPGGGPMFDMGPYYLTALLNCLGPVKRISAFANIAIPTRTITSEPKRGKQFHVQTPDHIAGTMEFENGCIGSIITSFATMHPTYDGAQPITIYGERGTLRMPDPNCFDGHIHLHSEGEAEWKLMPPATPIGYGRSVGAADMAAAICEGRQARASAEQGMAVLDLMQGFLDSAGSGRAFEPACVFSRAAGIRAGEIAFNPAP